MRGLKGMVKGLDSPGTSLKVQMMVLIGQGRGLDGYGR